MDERSRVALVRYRANDDLVLASTVLALLEVPLVRLRVLVLSLVVLGLAMPAQAKKKGSQPEAATTAEPEVRIDADLLAGLSFRGIGPAVTSGRVIDLAVDPRNRKRYYAATVGGVWKTINGGVTWQPIFDDQGSYSIGCVTIDPNNPSVIWVGSGENNSQRSVGYGDGVYKSLDGGSSWTKMGLEGTEHIGMIVVDPRDSNTVYVAAQGPLWSAGGERGLYKTTDGGATWSPILEVDEHTGVSEVLLDPRDPDVIYAVTYQRRRHVWTLINGGPGSGIHKSTDGGANWSQLAGGLPSGEVGRIGITMALANPDVLYAVVEASADKGGFFRSDDRGASWRKQSSYVTGSPQYYQELIPDPLDVDRVYAMDTWMQVTEDGGRAFSNVGENTKHVDNHALWIDPADTDYLLAGCDGGIYESFDRGANWRYIANLPITQFYKIEVDNDAPFYNVYGGTQDNNTLGGPTRTASANGITNSDWYVTVGGDGFQPRIDPDNPDIVYSQWQNGNLIRFDRQSGEIIDIRPQPEPGDDPPRWNWDSPLIISPHAGTRLYYGSQRLWRSDDRGDSWRAVSGDLTAQLDRNQLEVMGKVWHIDAVSKNRSTSYYGNLVALSESPRVEGLLYVGSDDGVVQVSEDGGANWREVAQVPGVPAMTYVNRLEASLHDDDTVYAAFNNHKMGDFAPYVYESRDRGRTWNAIAGDPDDGGLPARGSVYSLAQDHEQASLLFVGTEFGVYVSLEGGGRWLPLGSGLPVVAVRDLAIQRRENDLVLGTFGRGFYVLDDYSPLRELSEQSLSEEGQLFAVKPAWMYMESMRLGLPGKSFQGDSFYSAPNPPFGATFTYYLQDDLETLEAQRHRARDEAEEAGEATAYPSWDTLRAEAREEPPSVFLTVRDPAGNIVRRIEGATTKGIHRSNWDLRYAPAVPAQLEAYDTSNPFSPPPTGSLAVPGTYQVTLSKRIDGVETVVSAAQSFETKPLGTASLPANDYQALVDFQGQTARLQRAVLGAIEVVGGAQGRLALIKVAMRDTPGIDTAMHLRVRDLEHRLADLEVALTGDRVVGRRSKAISPAIVDRVWDVVAGHWTATSAPTQTHRRNYAIAAEAFAPVLQTLRTLVEGDLAALESDLEDAGAPWTPGRVPRWQPE